MITNIIEMLEIAKKQKSIGKFTHIALGKNKIPMGIVEAYQQNKREKWLKE